MSSAAIVRHTMGKTTRSAYRIRWRLLRGACTLYIQNR